MPRRPKPRNPNVPDDRANHEAVADAPAPASKTRRKAAMHDLQDLGVTLVELEPKRFHELAAEAALPEGLVDAIVACRSITAWGARKRQCQYIGRLMRDVDPEPIRRKLDGWAHGNREDTERLHAVERLRDDLLARPAALEAFVANHPGADRGRLAALVTQAHAERASGRPPHAYRELFRLLKELGNPSAAGQSPSP